MKKIVLFLIIIFPFCISINAQETTKPINDKEIVRNVSVLDIEGETFNNVSVIMKSVSPDSGWSTSYYVRVKVKNTTGKKKYDKIFNNAFLYVFSDGQIEIGNPNFIQLMIYKASSSDIWLGIIREKEGIYF